MKTLLSLLALAGTTLASAAVVPHFEGLDDFTDFSISGRSEANARTVFEGALERASRLQSIVGEERTLELTFTDIDMAGDIQPWRNREFADIRYVEAIYPPRLEFSYVLRDSECNEIACFTENRRDLGFLQTARLTGRYEPFHYELQLLNNWARRNLPQD